MTTNYEVFVYDEMNCEKLRGFPVASIASWATENDFLNYLQMMSNPCHFLDECFKQNQTVRLRIGSSCYVYTKNTKRIITPDEYSLIKKGIDAAAISTSNHLTNRRTSYCS